MDMTLDVQKAVRSTEGHDRCGIGGGGAAFETEVYILQKTPSSRPLAFAIVESGRGTLGGRSQMARIRLIAAVLITLAAARGIAQEHQHGNGE
jgi:hypothetical protein